MGGKAPAAVEKGQRGNPNNVVWGSDGHSWICRGYLVPTGQSLARCPLRGCTHPYGHFSTGSIAQQHPLRWVQLWLLAFGLSSTGSCLLALPVEKGLQRVRREDAPWGSASWEQGIALHRREILRIPRTLTRSRCSVHTHPARRACGGCWFLELGLALQATDLYLRL